MRRGWFLWGLAGIIAPRWTARRFGRIVDRGYRAEHDVIRERDTGEQMHVTAAKR